MVIAVIQARMSSTRLPGKVLKDIAGKPMILHMLDRVKRSKLIDKIIIATSTSPANDPLCTTVTQAGFSVFRGSENDVLSRYYEAVKDQNHSVIVRLTGDCPLIDHHIIDKVIKCFLDNNFDYVSNIDPPTFPDGLDTEVFSFSALKTAWQDAKSAFDHEHVTPYIRNSGKFTKANIAHSTDLSALRWTVDDREDFILAKNIFEHLLPVNDDFGLEDVLKYKSGNPDIFSINASTQRNEGMNMSQGVKLWKRAKKVIAGGNSLLSKRPDMFLPDAWPSYFDKAKGIEVWDLDGVKYTDMSIMGIGTNVLGYANDEVDAKVMEAVKKSNVSTLNCPEEVYLAEKLVEIHPWAEMVRYARTGGEACAMAIRIARAASGKDKIAFCGYHGWSDWYLASNLSDEKNLDGQLLPGLKPNGVPRGLLNTMYPFNYNKFDELEKIISNNDIGVIIMEPVRNDEPADGFLKKVRDLATQKGIILIFDEITAGFRRCVGGIHKCYGINPDMAVLGKAMGNGYAISAIIGKREIMDAVQTTFISSTFWTERIGPVAALETIKIMERDNVPQQINDFGLYINKCWKELGNKHGLPIKIEGLPALTHFSFDGLDNRLIKTFITQEMLAKGYLAANSVYTCNLHSHIVIDRYIDALDAVFKKVKAGIDNGNLQSYLQGAVCQSGFKRLI